MLVRGAHSNADARNNKFKIRDYLHIFICCRRRCCCCFIFFISMLFYNTFFNLINLVVGANGTFSGTRTVGIVRHSSPYWCSCSCSDVHWCIRCAVLCCGWAELSCALCCVCVCDSRRLSRFCPSKSMPNSFQLLWHDSQRLFPIRFDLVCSTAMCTAHIVCNLP